MQTINRIHGLGFGYQRQRKTACWMNCLDGGMCWHLVNDAGQIKSVTLYYNTWRYLQCSAAAVYRAKLYRQHEHPAYFTSRTMPLYQGLDVLRCTMGISVLAYRSNDAFLISPATCTATNKNSNPRLLAASWHFTLKITLVLSRCFDGHYSWVSWFYWSEGWWKWWWQLEWYGMLGFNVPLDTVYVISETGVTTGAIRRANLQSNHQHQQTNTLLFTGRMHFLSQNQRCQSNEAKIRKNTF